MPQTSAMRWALNASLLLILSTALGACWPFGCGDGKRKLTPDEQAWFDASELNKQMLLQTGACEGCELWRAQLPGAKLRGAKLKDANITESNLRGADLREADLRGTGLSADLRGADLRGAIVVPTPEPNGERRGPSFNGGRLRLVGTRLDGLDLRDVKFADSTDWSGAILSGADMRGVSFSGMGGQYRKTEPKHWLDPTFGGSLLVGTDMRDADLRGAYFVLCNLQNADLRGANLEDANFSSANLIGTKFDGAKLTGAKLLDAEIAPGQRCAQTSIGRCVPEVETKPEVDASQKPEPTPKRKPRPKATP